MAFFVKSNSSCGFWNANVNSICQIIRQFSIFDTNQIILLLSSTFIWIFYPAAKKYIFLCTTHTISVSQCPLLYLKCFSIRFFKIRKVIYGAEHLIFACLYCICFPFFHRITSQICTFIYIWNCLNPCCISLFICHSSSPFLFCLLHAVRHTSFHAGSSHLFFVLFHLLF